MRQYGSRRSYGPGPKGYSAGGFSGRPHTFGPKRFRLRYAALAMVCFGVMAAGASLFDNTAADNMAVAPATKPVFTAQADPAAQAHLHNSDSLIGVFTSKPAAPDYSFDAGNTPIPAQKPRAATTHSAEKTSLKKGIDRVVAMGSGLVNKTLTVGKGDTLMDLLTNNDVPRAQAYNAIEALKKVYDPRRLHPQHEVTVFFHRDPAEADPQFQGLSIEKDVITTVRVNRTDEGTYEAKKQDKKIESRLRSYGGTIDNSLYVSANNAGMPDNVIIDLIRMYSWSVDFQRDIQGGDSFEVLYREFTTEDGDTVPGKGEILFARLALGERNMPFYLFTDAEGDKDYFDDEGQSAKKTLMRTPIDGARLSSGFGMRRHPVLGYNKMHKGVDFAAPRGTPIYAAGDGTIVYRGRKGGYGNYVRIRHSNGLETAYAHMNGFKAGQNRGSRVKQGQVIGYVGTTGRSTGPHLHYEVLRGGAQVNPRSLKLPTGKKLAGKDLKKFKAVVAELNGDFKRLQKPTTQVAARR